MKYIGYGLKYNKWRSNDVITDLNDDDGCSDDGVPSLDRRQLSPITRKFHLFEVEELVCNIKSSLYVSLSSGRKSDPCCSISDMSFHFEALLHQSMKTHKRKDSNVWLAVIVKT